MLVCWYLAIASKGCYALRLHMTVTFVDEQVCCNFHGMVILRMDIHRFGQRVRCVCRNKELTPKGENVKLITWWKHVPDRVVFFYVFLGFLDGSFIISYVKISRIRYTKNATPYSKFCINFETFLKFPENFPKI